MAPALQWVREGPVDSVAHWHDNAFGVWGQQFQQRFAAPFDAFGQLAVHDGTPGRWFFHRWTGGRIPAAAEWLGDWGFGLLRCFATEYGLQQRIGCSYRNAQWPNRKPHRHCRYSDIYADRH